MNTPLKIVIIGGNGLIGSRLAKNLTRKGHDVLAASRSSGVDVLTGAGLAKAFAGAQVVIDVTNSPSFEDTAVLNFFQTSCKNLLAAEADAGVGYHLALSVVGADRLPSSGYLRAKIAQEKLIAASPVLYTIVRATQFFEFVGDIAQGATQDQTIRLPSAGMQPIAADDVAAVLADIAEEKPVNGIVELGGPEIINQDDLVRQFLKFKNDPRQVISDPQARYFGTVLEERSLVPEANARRGTTRFADWLTHHA